ncbi:BRO family protein [Streptomyces sp. VNUA24]|uniref:BRO-N domain-containing protein n=1 Tax=Streptomyces sp. VNUA24 TaxID=3031131 RepID=UPI0023B86B85|nr:BRO family protein [Streptomyces sp. VNUA24]WEH16691.1 BRO family protein [Streptomyces sp. VNUA24]
MIEPSKHQPEPGPRHEAINISDFVYAATGARVRRLTMPDGAHWFPAVDVCKELGHTNTQKALSDHVPEEQRESLEILTGGYSLSVPAGREWRRDMNVISLQGLILLVNACTKPACLPFKQWVAEVIEAVQRNGSYSLAPAEVQPSGPDGPIAYAMPEQVAEAIVRLEERNLQLDEQFAATQHRALALQEQIAATQQEMVETQRTTLTVIAQAMERIANRLDALVPERSAPDAAAFSAQPTTETVLADWRERLSVTEDVWTVAVVIAPVLVEKGELRQPLEAIAARTGLSVHRVNECLRLLRKHACIHPMGAAEDGAPVYVLSRR